MQRTCIVLSLILSISAVGAVEADDANWPSFRGHQARGFADGHLTPTAWSVSERVNIKWKTPIPGLGHSSPVIWGDRLFVTTAISGKSDPKLKVGLYGNIDPVNDDTEHRWLLYCLDKKSGKVLWQRAVVKAVPRVKRHPKASHANSTPATDGKHVVAFYGSEGIYCYDFDGNLVWKKDLGPLDSGYFKVPKAQWGFGSSPIIHGDKVIVQCDVQKNGFIAALSLKDGSEIWRVARDEVPTWSTPTIHEHGESTQIIVNGYRHIGAYDLESGKEIWRLRGGGDIPVPTPVVGSGLIFITNAHGGMAPIYAIRSGARGDVSLAEGATSNDHIAWSTTRSGAYMQTPLVYNGHLYVCADNGVLTCFDAKSGEIRYRTRLGGGSSGFTASSVAADGKIYFTGELGDVFVVKAGPEFEVLAENAIDEIVMSTPAISEGTLFFRAREHVIAVAELKTGPSFLTFLSERSSFPPTASSIEWSRGRYGSLRCGTEPNSPTNPRCAFVRSHRPVDVDTQMDTDSLVATVADTCRAALTHCHRGTIPLWPEWRNW